MQVKIKRIDTSLPLPEYHTDGAVAFDLYARTEVILKPNSFDLIATNFIIETPPGYMLMLAARSSSAKKKGLNLRNGIAVIDQDYSGNKDEIFILVQNLTDQQVIIKKQERIAQGVFVKIDKPKFIEVEDMKNKTRGGFGSTG